MIKNQAKREKISSKAAFINTIIKVSDFWLERKFKVAREVRKVACHGTVAWQSTCYLVFFRCYTYSEQALKDGERSIDWKKARDRGIWWDKIERESAKNKGDAFSLTGLHRDFTAEHLADAIRRLASIDGRVYVVPVALRAER